MMAATATLTPNVLYAQNKDQIFLTIDLQDVKEPKVETTATSVTFNAQKDAQKYHFEIELFDNVKPEVILC